MELYLERLFFTEINKNTEFEIDEIYDISWKSSILNNYKVEYYFVLFVN